MQRQDVRQASLAAPMRRTLVRTPCRLRSIACHAAFCLVVERLAWVQELFGLQLGLLSIFEFHGGDPGTLKDVSNQVYVSAC